MLNQIADQKKVCPRCGRQALTLTTEGCLDCWDKAHGLVRKAVLTEERYSRSDRFIYPSEQYDPMIGRFCA